MAESTEKVRPSAEQIKAARMLTKLTQRQLADAAGISTRALEKFESGHTVPHGETLDKIVQAFEVRGIIFSNGARPSVTLDPSKATITTA